MRGGESQLSTLTKVRLPNEKERMIWLNFTELRSHTQYTQYTQYKTHLVRLASGVIGVEVPGEANARLRVSGVPVDEHPSRGSKQTQQSEGGLGDV